MLKIFWIFLIFNMVIADDEESNEKYIDLLPEEEKQEFLNRIARRIFEEIQSRDIPNESHTEINDDQLEAHNEFVQDIINEESRNLKNERRADSDKMGENDKDEHIDLTLRDNKREKRKNTDEGNQEDTTKEVSYDVIPVKTVYDEENEQVKDAITTDNLENIDISQDTTVSPNSTENNKYDDPEYVSGENTNNLRKSQLINGTGTTEIIDFEPNANILPSTNDNNNHFEITNTQSSNYNNTETWSSTQKIYEENDSNKEGDAQNFTGSIIDNTPATEIITSLNDETESVDTDTISVTDNDNSPTDETQNYQKFQRSGSDLNEISKSTYFGDIVSTTPVTHIDVTKNISAEETDVIKVNGTNESINVNIEEDDHVKPKTESLTNNYTKGILRQNSHPLEEEHNVPEINLVINPKKEYRVYEVAADKPPFAKLNKKQGIPIYNYAPEYAYFRPDDKETHLVDSKKESEESDENDSRTRNEIINLLSNPRKRKQKTKELNVHANTPLLRSPHIRSTFIRYNKKGPIKEFQIKPNPQNIYGFLKPIHKKIINRNIYYNPYDYMDMDYVNQFHGVNTFRSGIQNRFHKHFPDSSDADHPMNLIHKSDTVKDHVGAIRHLLYLQKVFGYIPDVHGKRKSDLPTKITRQKHDRSKQDAENIAADYYFGRVYSVEDISEPVDTTKDKTKHKINTERQMLENEDSDETVFGKFFETMGNVLNDIIRFDNDALKQYDWLKTTVEIQGAIHKLLDLSHDLQHGEDVSHEDLELFKYTLYLFKISKMDFEENLVRELPEPSIKKKPKGFLPKIKKINKIKHPVILWKNFAKYIRNVDEVENEFGKLNIFYEFIDFLHKLQFHLDDVSRDQNFEFKFNILEMVSDYHPPLISAIVQSLLSLKIDVNGVKVLSKMDNSIEVYLFQLHEAIKHIAMITTYKTQNWFKDLKAIYLDKASRKNIGEVILHLSLVRLIDKIDEHAENGAAEDYRSFLSYNKEEVDKVKEDFVFIIQILKELKKL